MKYIWFFVVSLLVLNSNSLQGKTDETHVFGGIASVKIEARDVDIQFVLTSSPDVDVILDTKNITGLTMTSQNGVLKIVRTAGNLPLKFQVHVRDTYKLDVSVSGKSHVFIPNMKVPVHVTAADLSESTIGGCAGLILTQKDFTKTQVNQLSGNMLVTQRDHSELGIKDGNVFTALITATELSRVSIASTIHSLKLITKGRAHINLGRITEAFMWTGRGNEKVYIKNLTGIADVTANYDSVLTVENADLQTLLAATSSTGKIKVYGTVKNAGLSARGASEIIIGKITGKILRRNASSKGIIRILNR